MFLCGLEGVLFHDCHLVFFLLWLLFFRLHRWDWSNWFYYFFRSWLDLRLWLFYSWLSDLCDLCGLWRIDWRNFSYFLCLNILCLNRFTVFGIFGFLLDFLFHFWLFSWFLFKLGNRFLWLLFHLSLYDICALFLLNTWCSWLRLYWRDNFFYRLFFLLRLFNLHDCFFLWLLH